MVSAPYTRPETSALAHAPQGDQDADLARLDALYNPGAFTRYQDALAGELVAADADLARLVERRDALAADLQSREELATRAMLAGEHSREAAKIAAARQEIATAETALAHLTKRRAELAMQARLARLRDSVAHTLACEVEVATRLDRLRALFAPIAAFERFPPEYNTPPLPEGRSRSLIEYTASLRRATEWEAVDLGVDLAALRAEVDATATAGGGAA